MKKLNIKALFVDHFEKMLFGLFGLIVLVVLATSSWARIDDTPDKLLDNIKKVKSKIESSDNVWADRDVYKVIDYTEQANKLFTPVSNGQFEFSTPLFHPLFKKNEPRREPTFLPVLELTAKASLVSLSMKKEQSVTPMTGDEPTGLTAANTNKPTSIEDKEFADRRQLGNRTGAQPGGPFPGDGPGNASGLNMTMTNGTGIGLNRKKGRADGDDEPGTAVQMATYDPNMTSRGVRVIAIRGVFPLRQQIEEYKKALHLTDMEAANLVEIADFVLERQVAVAGPDPWKGGKWETVNIDTAIDVLSESSGIDPVDPVPIRMQDAVITMKLPLRLIGEWDQSATHPKIQNEELRSEEDFAKQNNLLDKLEETFNESNMVENVKPRRKGFTKGQSDIKSIVGQMRNDEKSSRLMKQKLQQIQDGSLSPVGGYGSTPIDMLVADTRYLLFRYLDFDVQSGYAYRYRVRLKLRNPNFEGTEEQLAAADPNIRKGDERESPWSSVSNAEVVPKTVNYFLEDVERDPYRDAQVRTNTRPVIQLNMFDFDTKLGTVVNDKLGIFSIGSFIGGELKKETLVLDLAQPIGEQLIKKKYQFATSDVLLDVESDSEILPEQHPDLKFPSGKSRGNARMGIVEEALVFTSLGEVKAIDPVSGKAEEERIAKRVRAERSGREVAAAKSTNPLSAAGETNLLGDNKGRQMPFRRNARLGNRKKNQD